MSHSENDLTLLAVKGAVTELSPEAQQSYHAKLDHLRDLHQAAKVEGEQQYAAFILAFTVLGLELSK